MSAGPAPVLPVVQLGIDYDDQRDKIGQFLSNFTTSRGSLLHYDGQGRLVSNVHQPDDRLATGSATNGYVPPDLAPRLPDPLPDEAGGDPDQQVSKYALLLQQIANRDLDTLIIDIDDLFQVGAFFTFVFITSNAPKQKLIVTAFTLPSSRPMGTRPLASSWPIMYLPTASAMSTCSAK